METLMEKVKSNVHILARWKCFKNFLWICFINVERFKKKSCWCISCSGWINTINTTKWHELKVSVLTYYHFLFSLKLHSSLTFKKYNKILSPLTWWFYPELSATSHGLHQRMEYDQLSWRRFSCYQRELQSADQCHHLHLRQNIANSADEDHDIWLKAPENQARIVRARCVFFSDVFVF